MSHQLPGVWLRLPRAWLRLLTGEIVDNIWRRRTRGGAGDGAGHNTGGGGVLQVLQVLQVGHGLLLSQSPRQLLQRSAGYRI